MHQLTTDKLLALLVHHEPPCISLYQPTHRHHPENQQDPIRFKNLIRVIEETLQQQYPDQDFRELMEPFHELSADSQFWKHQTRDGLAIFAGAGVHEVIQLQRPLREVAFVAASFHVKPLMRYLQSADRFQVLALTRDSAAVFEGDRYSLDPATLADDFPSSLEDVVEPERSEKGVSVGSANSGVGSPKMLRGHGEGKHDIDTEKYFRAVDQSVGTKFSKPSGLPLVLAVLPEHEAMFRRVSQNPWLLTEGVSCNPDALSEDELRQQVWKILEPHYLSRLEGLKENYSNAAARQTGACELSDVAQAAVAGRVGTLLVEADRVIPGVIDKITGSIRAGAPESHGVDDMLDDLAELVLVMGGKVLVVPAERMPTSSGLAAIYRY